MPRAAPAATPELDGDVGTFLAEQRLWRRGVRLLVDNWAGSYTVPSRTLYPHQWSWDSAFVTMGLAPWAQRRAQLELHSLFGAQWADGRVPHIVFSAEVPLEAYFPGPDFWRSDRVAASPAARTSGIVQPPVHARAAWEVYLRGADRKRAREFLSRIYPRLAAYHRYLAERRDIGGYGLAAITHPWESGLDNSPAWDEPLGRVASPGGLDGYVRRDLAHTAEDERPTDTDYARYVALASSYRDSGYCDDDLAGHHAFLVEDPLFNTVYAWSERALAEIAAVIGADPRPHTHRAAVLTEALRTRLYDPEAGMFLARDLHAGELIRARSIAGLTPLILPDLPEALVRPLVATACSPRFGIDDGGLLPSFDRTAPAFDKRRYWRGPAWLNLNWLIWQGLREHGRADLAGVLRAGMLRAASRCGYREYFDPVDGSGCGSRDFSWSAALTLDLLSRARRRSVAA
ncbi:MAG: MGH1-like glycoside hydrolase domain-containing protein [Carbonactinosporaceae bacterium]